MMWRINIFNIPRLSCLLVTGSAAADTTVAVVAAARRAVIVGNFIFVIGIYVLKIRGQEASVFGWCVFYELGDIGILVKMQIVGKTQTLYISCMKGA